MNLHEVFFEPLTVTLEQRVGAGGSAVDLATLQSRVELGAALGSDELRIFQAQNIGEQATFIVGREPDRLGPDS